MNFIIVNSFEKALKHTYTFIFGNTNVYKVKLL